MKKGDCYNRDFADDTPMDEWAVNVEQDRMRVGFVQVGGVLVSQYNHAEITISSDSRDNSLIDRNRRYAGHNVSTKVFNKFIISRRLNARLVNYSVRGACFDVKGFKYLLRGHFHVLLKINGCFFKLVGVPVYRKKINGLVRVGVRWINPPKGYQLEVISFGLRYSS